MYTRYALLSSFLKHEEPQGLCIHNTCPIVRACSYIQQSSIFSPLADDGLPKVPSLTVRIPPNYPLVSPECDLTHYDATPFLKDVAKLLSERLARSNSVYTLSALLSGWESCVLRAMTNELTSQEE